ncbi:MAG TPA: hypothetical protein VMM83_04305 [Longimicrobiales bacterium]|nr:hypothetical protein [Longimicrobiales bacterium]
MGATLPLLALLASPAPSRAQTLMTQEEALAVAFPAAKVERRTAFLTDAQLAEARRLAGEDVDIETGIVTYYVGFRDGRLLGAAYFDAHRVRTKAEVAMIVVGPSARIERVDILKFMEPPEYRAPEGWIAQLEDRPLDDDLSLQGSIRSMTGATLTARALTRAARRVLALHGVIGPFEKGEKDGQR